jgi:hypothetical protein
MRQEIIDTLEFVLGSRDTVLALWLEGADANTTVDEYSDLDLSCAVKPGYMDEIEELTREVLSSFDVLDQDYITVDESDRRQIVFHIANSSPYLLIDFDLLVDCGSTFYRNDNIEKPKVIFDRANVIHYVDEITPDFTSRILELDEVVWQSVRVEKYIIRGNLIEAFGYYQKYILSPLLEILRMRYTPLHTGYGIVHMSRDFPQGVVRQVEKLYLFSSLDELENNCREALNWYYKTKIEVLS